MGSQYSEQQSAAVAHGPPSGTQDDSPPQTPSMQLQPQQSASVVQRPPSGMQVSPPGQQTSAPAASGAQRPQQHSSANEQGCRSAVHVPSSVP